MNHLLPTGLHLPQGQERPTPEAMKSWLLDAVQHHQAGELESASQLYQKILQVQAQHVDALHLLGVVLFQMGKADEAVGLIRQALTLQPRMSSAHTNLGNALQALGQYEDALQHYSQALSLAPGQPQTLFNRGNAFLALKQWEEALMSFDASLATQENQATVYFNRAQALLALKRPEEALASYDRAITLQPDYAEACNSRGVVLMELHRHEEALASFQKAIALQPGLAEAHNNLGEVLHRVKRLEEAQDSYQRAIAIRPDFAAAFYNLGNLEIERKRFEAALQCFDRAIDIQPDMASAFLNRGSALKMLNRLVEAIESFEASFKLQPDQPFLWGTMMQSRHHICDWSDRQFNLDQLGRRLEQGEQVCVPFPLLAMTDAPALHRLCSEIWIQHNLPKRAAWEHTMSSESNRRLRIAYYSADFHNHATAYLMAGLFELHDKQRFELFAFSFGPDLQDSMRLRIRQAFDHFIDVRHLSDEEVARQSRALGIDIAVDLKGFTQDARTGIFAHRCAPVQVQYLGYPGTMGADFIDYVLADTTVIPPDQQVHYAEKIAYLPHSYQVNDRHRSISDKKWRRSELGLPEEGFVFCCFNNNYKITPATFDGWMRLLQQVPRSVLWLLSDSPSSMQNLEKEAQRRGVDPKRLVFAKRVHLPDHLARHQAADLFLDTFPYNAHTTTSDALWAGLPVLTLMGQSFASRVAASLLNTVGLPELITRSQEEYEACALALATQPDLLTGLRQRLANNRLTTPLFDTALFTRHLEQAYEHMIMRHREGLPPAHFHVPSLHEPSRA